MDVFLSSCVKALKKWNDEKTRHTHTHPLSGTIHVSRYQKGKTNLDFTGARDSEWQWHLLGHMQIAPRSRQITTPEPHHSVFYRPDALPAAQPTASKHRRHEHWRHSLSNYLLTDNKDTKRQQMTVNSRTLHAHNIITSNIKMCGHCRLSMLLVASDWQDMISC